MFTDDEVKARILHKLYRLGKWGASHTSFDNLKKGFNMRDLGKKGASRVDDLAQELIKSNWLRPKPTGYGTEVSLNPQFSSEIVSFMKQFFPDIE
jgi:hypothetical protein